MTIGLSKCRDVMIRRLPYIISVTDNTKMIVVDNTASGQIANTSFIIIVN